MGYSETQKGYILMDLNAKTFFVSRNVVFKEHIFPFATSIEVVQNYSPPPLDYELLDDALKNMTKQNQLLNVMLIYQLSHLQLTYLKFTLLMIIHSFYPQTLLLKHP